MLPPIFQTLKASSAVTDIVDPMKPRIYRHGEAPQRPDGLALPSPYVTWFVVSDVPENNLSDTPPSDRVTVQIDCWHQTDSGVERLAEAVRDAMEAVCHMTGLNFDGRELESRLYRISLQFDYWLDRGRQAP